MAEPVPESPLPTRPYRHREHVRWVDADLQGVLNNAVYLTLFEQARYGYFRSLGLMRGEAFPFLLGETGVRFERPIGPGAEVVVEAVVSRLGGKSFDMQYRVLVGAEQHATGSATLVWVDENLRSSVVPDEARRRISEYEGIAERSER